jgi:hypothetical protein
MNRARFVAAATIASAAMVYTGGVLAAQAVKAPPMRQVLAGKTFTPPVKGEALIDFTQPVTKRVKANVVTTIRVKNTSTAPIARLQVTETWYDKGGAVVAGGKGVIASLLQPQDVQEIVITTPFNSKMSSNNWNFSHANGTVKVNKVKELPDPVAEAAPPQ